VIIMKLSFKDAMNESEKNREDDVAMKIDVDEKSEIFASTSNWKEESKGKISSESILIDIESYYDLYIYTKLVIVSNDDSFVSFSITCNNLFASNL